MELKLTGRNALVTGANGGLGSHFAATLAAAGANVAIAARRVESLRPVQDALANHGVNVESVALDVTDPASVAAAFEQASSALGPITVVINNAGVAVTKPLLEQTEEDWQQVIEVNLNGAWRVAQTAARHMVAHRQGGSIVNIASILGLRGVGQIPQAGYAASKGGIVNLTRELGAQWARKGIRVNAIAPGWFESEMTSDMFSEESGHKWVARRAPMGRHGKEGELDGALLYLASDASSYVTGQILAVDGGWTSV